MLSRIKKIFKSPLFFPIAITSIFFIINLVLVLNHEPWRDEANVWQGAKNLSFTNFYDILRVEPHPPLWLILLAPLAKLGLPMITSNLLSLCVLTLAVFLLARFAPFSKKTKTILIFSAALFYILPVMSRNYSLIPLALTLLAIIYPLRLKKPIAFTLAFALLFQSHFLAAGLASALFFFFIYDLIKQKTNKKLLIIVISITLLSCLASLPMILGSLRAHSIVMDTFAHNSQLDWALELNRSLFASAFPIFELIMLPLLLLLLFYSRRSLIYLLFALSFHLLVVTHVYDTGILQTQKNLLILLYVVFVFWISAQNHPAKSNKFSKFIHQQVQKLEITKLVYHIPKSTPMVLLALASIPQIYSAAYYDLHDNYSYSYQVSDYLNQNTPEDAVFIVGDATAAGTAITFVPHLEANRHFYDLATQGYIDFYQYEKYPKLNEEQILDAISLFPPGSNLYYIAAPSSPCDSSQTINPDLGWELIQTFESNPVASESALEIYKLPTVLFDNTINTEKVTDIFNLNSIPRLNITTGDDFTTEYAVWNDSVKFQFENAPALKGKIRTRGNTTYEAGRKYGPYQYKIKLKEAASLLNMPAHREWVLLANFMDKSYIRQFYLSGVGQLLMGSDYFAPQMRYLELYLNDKYQGLYLLVESIEEDENRLDLEKYYQEDSPNTPFLVQMENGRMPRLWGDWYDKSTLFMIDDQAKPCMDYEELNGASFTDTMISLEYPDSFDDISQEQGNYIKNQIENLYRDAREGKNFFELNIDHVSFVNYFAFQEIMYNTGFGSSSIYFYQGGNKKITAGPLWDFDQLMMADISAGFIQPPACDNQLYRYLLKHPEFKELLSARLDWFDLKLGPVIKAQLQNLQDNDTLRQAVYRNEAKYQTWGRSFPDLSVYQHPVITSLKTWDEHIDYLRQALFYGHSNEQGEQISRTRWLIENIDAL